MLSDSQLRNLAGDAAYARGRLYAEEGRIRLVENDDRSVRGLALGSETYELWLKLSDNDWRWHCTCPAADGGRLCKHLVAAVLMARDGVVIETGYADTNTTKKRAAAPRDDLDAFLRAQPAERLAGWLKALADADSDIDRRLRLYRAADDPVELKAALAKVLGAGGFLDYRASIRYAQRLGAALDSLHALLARDAMACRVLCEYAVGRLLRVYQRCDDSAGAIGARVGEIAQLHAQACHQTPPGKTLVKPLLALQRSDEWDLFPLRNYWQALGAEGQSAYGKAIQPEIHALLALPADQRNTRRAESFGALHRAEDYARCVGDFDLLQRVLRWDLTHPHDYLRVLDSLREFGRAREALAFGEAAVKRFPNDDTLHNALGECLHAAALHEEAIEQFWLAFCARPGERAWDALKRHAQTDWLRWREKALARLSAAERGDAAPRVLLLLHDGDIDTAIALARELPVSPPTLQMLAERIEPLLPDLAGEFHLRLAVIEARDVMHAAYPRLVAHLRNAARLLPASAWQPVVARVRAEHARKPRLMTLLTEAGL